MWGSEPRIGSLSVKIDHWVSFMDHGSFMGFKDILDFLNILVTSNQMKMQELELQQQKTEELRHVGRTNLGKYLEEKTRERGAGTARQKSKVQYTINEGSLKLTTSDMPFINVKLQNFVATSISFADDSSNYVLKMHSIEIENLLENTPDYKLILSRFPDALPEEDMIQFTNEVFFVAGIANPTHRWKVFDKFEFKIAPMVIKLTEEIYQKFYEWSFQEPKISEDQKKEGKVKLKASAQKDKKVFKCDSLNNINFIRKKKRVKAIQICR